MCACQGRSDAAIVQYFLCGGHHSGSAEVRGGPANCLYLDDAPKGEDGRPREEGTLEMVRRAVWGMLCADDAEGGVDVASWAYQDHGCYSCRMSGIRTDSVGEEDRGHAPVVRLQHSVERAAN